MNNILNENIISEFKYYNYDSKEDSNNEINGLIKIDNNNKANERFIKSDEIEKNNKTSESEESEQGILSEQEYDIKKERKKFIDICEMQNYKENNGEMDNEYLSIFNEKKNISLNDKNDNLNLLEIKKNRGELNIFTLDIKKDNIKDLLIKDNLEDQNNELDLINININNKKLNKNKSIHKNNKLNSKYKRK